MVRTAAVDPAMWSHPDSLEPVTHSHIKMDDHIWWKSWTSGM